MDRRDEGISHAILAVGILGILIISICIAWCIVLCERFRRKRKYRPGQQSRNSNTTGIVRTGPSPQFSRHLLVPKQGHDHLVIANRAFLSKSTPELLAVEEDDPWEPSSPCPSEPLLPNYNYVQISPSKHKYKDESIKVATQFQSDSQLNQPSHSRDFFLDLDFDMTPTPSKPTEIAKELSIHDQIAAILGTFPHLNFDFPPTHPADSVESVKMETSAIIEMDEVGKKRSASEEEGPESLVDDPICVVTVRMIPNGTTPTSTNPKAILRPSTLQFCPPSPSHSTSVDNLDEDEEDEIRPEQEHEVAYCSPEEDDEEDAFSTILETTL